MQLITNKNKNKKKITLQDHREITKTTVEFHFKMFNKMLLLVPSSRATLLDTHVFAHIMYLCTNLDVGPLVLFLLSLADVQGAGNIAISNARHYNVLLLPENVLQFNQNLRLRRPSVCWHHTLIHIVSMYRTLTRV